MLEIPPGAALLRKSQLLERLPFGKTKLHEMLDPSSDYRDESFPRPIFIGQSRTPLWISTDIDRWITDTARRSREQGKPPVRQSRGRSLRNGEKESQPAAVAEGAAEKKSPSMLLRCSVSNPHVVAFTTASPDAKPSRKVTIVRRTTTEIRAEREAARLLAAGGALPESAT